MLGKETKGRLGCVAGFEVELVLEGQGGKSGRNGEQQKMQVANNDNSTLVGDGSTIQVSQSSPFLEVEEGIRVGDKAVALGVARHQEGDPSEHSMSSVPSLSKGGGTPSSVVCSGVGLAPLLHGVIKHGH